MVIISNIGIIKSTNFIIIRGPDEKGILFMLEISLSSNHSKPIKMTPVHNGTRAIQLILLFNLIQQPACDVFLILLTDLMRRIIRGIRDIRTFILKKHFVLLSDFRREDLIFTAD